MTALRAWPARGTGYVKPVDVSSPQPLVSLDRVLLDGGENDVSIARGAWDGTPCLLIRWNGTSLEPNGFPNPRGYPAWHVIPDWMTAAVMASLADRVTDELRQSIRDPR